METKREIISGGELQGMPGHWEIVQKPA